MTPYEPLYGVQPNVLAEGRFVRYAEGHCEVYDTSTKRILRSRNFILAEEPQICSKPAVTYDVDQHDERRQQTTDQTNELLEQQYAPIEFLEMRNNEFLHQFNLLFQQFLHRFHLILLLLLRSLMVNPKRI
jgi:hypothetical protein